jgi:predicted acyl esterase
MEGPQVWAYMPGQSAAEAGGGIPGRWVSEPQWPPRTRPEELPLGRWRLGGGEGGVVEIGSDAVVGLATPEWVPFAPPQFPQEQSLDDDEALAFDTDPLETPLEIFGAPIVRLRIAASTRVAMVAARLCEVTPDGRSWLVSYGVLNLTHRDGHAEPQPLQAGRFYDVELPLYLAARSFRAGSRLRLALSGCGSTSAAHR